jgi:hypothetical protein
MDEPILPDAARVNGTAAAGTAEDPDASQDETRNDGPAGTGKGALRPTFLSGLAAAMRETAIRERERITGVVAEDAASHIEKVRSRAAIETEELRRLAEEDVEHIEQWSAQEIERIQGEATQQIDDRRSSLDVYLKQHASIIDTEIEGVNGAIRDYESTLDRFFNELSEETDPSAIVRRAGQLPPPPDLDEIRASARANAMTQFTEAESRAVEPEAAVDAGPIEAAAVSVDSTEAVEAARSIDASANADSPDQGDGTGGVMSGVMDDGVGSVEPTESMATPEPVETPVAQEDAPATTDGESAEGPAVLKPVAVMDPDAQRAPTWPAPAPTAEAAPIAPSIDHTSAAVRLLRSVAPWTAPTHVGNRGESDSE